MAAASRRKVLSEENQVGEGVIQRILLGVLSSVESGAWIMGVDKWVKFLVSVGELWSDMNGALGSMWSDIV